MVKYLYILIFVLCFKSTRAQYDSFVCPVENGTVEPQKYPPYLAAWNPSGSVLIYSPTDLEVKTVMNGYVAKIDSIPGEGFFILIRENEYLTAYGQLSTSFIEVGDVVQVGQRIGSLHSGNNKRILSFQFWKSRDQIDPVKLLECLE